jgi:hypothetical protein
MGPGFYPDQKKITCIRKGEHKMSVLPELTGLLSEFEQPEIPKSENDSSNKENFNLLENGKKEAIFPTEPKTVLLENEEFSSALEVVFDAHEHVATIYENLASNSFQQDSVGNPGNPGKLVGNPKWKQLAMRKALCSQKVRKTEEAVSAQLCILLDPASDEQAKLTAEVRIAQGMSCRNNKVYETSQKVSFNFKALPKGALTWEKFSAD